MTLREDVATHLAGHHAVAAVATGGVHKQLPNPLTTPDAFNDSGGVARLKPCLVLAQSSMPQFGPFKNSAKVNYAILCYAPTERQAEALSEAVLAALNDQQVGDVWWRWLDDTDYLPDDRFHPIEYYIITRYEAPTLRGE